MKFPFTRNGGSKTVPLMIDTRKGLFLAAGFTLVALATLGIFLPLLPTTPLLLLAAACFAQSSERWHRWLVEHRIFGPIIHHWHESRCVPLKVKIVSVSTILLFGGYTVGFALTHPYARLAGGLLIMTGLVVVLRIPICKGKP